MCLKHHKYCMDLMFRPFGLESAKPPKMEARIIEKLSEKLSKKVSKKHVGLGLVWSPKMVPTWSPNKNSFWGLLGVLGHRWAF